ncbi:hypothetical protein TRP8649_01461 [Pelagimonas phthalicica]|uniref:Uncharacterized protein n=1 Tax=Pelagimonas phthalicica TaxID=1037362 RepID=A0A238JB32_9RHOB|nr:hypothetical protein [Pelagimonas phthalicica]TDS94117.1 hypothetical protein CLV87_0611 [Pelagimonas phthalicica]SMX27357.1 hypothetical protein TRP8649_01461 [Pelagimonas phthalicica]
MRLLTYTLTCLALTAAPALADCKPGSCGKGKRCSYNATTGTKECIDATSKGLTDMIKDRAQVQGAQIDPSGDRPSK